MNLFETIAPSTEQDDDLTNYYTSPRNGGIRTGYDKVKKLFPMLCSYPLKKINT